MHNIKHQYTFIHLFIVYRIISSSVCFVHLKNKMKRNARMISWLKRLQQQKLLLLSMAIDFTNYSAYLIGNVCKTEIDHFYCYKKFCIIFSFFFKNNNLCQKHEKNQIYFNRTIKKCVFNRFVWYLCHLILPSLFIYPKRENEQLIRFE